MDKTLLFTCAALAMSRGAWAHDAVYNSGVDHVHLVELFSSEGCSSCPPAEALLGSWQSDARVWHAFIPVEMHVDYWDGLGWPDPFAQALFTARQQHYAAQWQSRSVYTPCFVIDGHEAGHHPSADELGQRGAATGALMARWDGAGVLRITFTPAQALASDTLEVNAVLLGSGLQSHVSRGENKGETLMHNFVALALTHALLHQRGPTYSGEVSLGTASHALRPQTLGFAAWVTAQASQVVLQTVGGPLSRQVISKP